ncbi:hypothetical protein AWZ03_012370 [Drosophila navojoa]|uniref:Uncharacterized protein n=1 Tax=Drosophila navojoa TaxID=7232 RepID=A0A484AX73_DRONA|nr:hypothetical protein AWZ03_012370 [Drosophila navojoa]
MDLDIPGTASVSVVLCVGLYVGEVNIVSDYRPDFPAALFLAWVVFMADRLRASIRILNQLWIFLIALGVYYLVSQGLVFYVWHPFWEFFEGYLNEFFETKFMYSFYDNYPSVVVFLRHHSLLIIQMLLMIYVLYWTLAQRVSSEDCSEEEYDEPVEHVGIHEEAFQQLLQPDRVHRLNDRLTHQ